MNNKGFAITTLLYGLSILGLLLILVLMSTVTSNRHNTKEVVQEIEEDLSRFSVSQASITSTNPNQAKEYVISEGHGGWYKIEVWSAKKGNNNGTYKAMTVKIPEYTSIYFYIGDSTTQDTIACLAEGGRSACTTANKLILSTANNDWPDPTIEYSQQTEVAVEDPPGSGNWVQKVNKFRISTVYNKAILKKTNESVGRARITFVTEDDNKVAEAKDPTDKNGNYYILSKNKINGSDSKWVALTAGDSYDDPVTAKTFTGSKNQTWTISTSPKYKSTDPTDPNADVAGEHYFSIINVGTGNALSSTTEGNYGHDIFANNKYVTNNDFRTQDWLIERIGPSIYTDDTSMGQISGAIDFKLSPFVKPKPESRLDDILQQNCGYTGSDQRFCIGKNAHHDTATSRCVESDEFIGKIVLNFNCQNIFFINAEL